MEMVNRSREPKHPSVAVSSRTLKNLQGERFDFDVRDDWAVARKRMVVEQIQARGITDQRLLNVMAQVPRHHFVDEALAVQAYGDHPLKIGQGQTISQPYMVAFMTEALRLSGGENILEIGTGCGYQTTILALLAKQVFTIERHQALALGARKIFRHFKLRNVIIRIGDGSLGWPEHAPFDRILMACVAPKLPKTLLSQLAPGGFLVLPVEDASGEQHLWRISRGPDGFVRENLGSCRFVPLIGRHGFRSS